MALVGKPAIKAQKKRREIIDQVISTLTGSDFQTVTVKMMCEAAGISVGTFYHYFRDKADFVIELFTQVDHHILEAIVPNLNSEDELENFRAFCVGVARYMMGVGLTRARLINASYPLLGDYERAYGRGELDRPFFLVPHAILTRAREKGQIDPALDIKRVAYMAVTVLRGFCFDWTRHDGSYDMAREIEYFSELFVRSFG